MSLGLTFDKLLIIAIIAVFVIGPDRLPQYAARLARLVRSLRDFATGARERVREEMGPEFDDIDWKKLDPRQYDPRRIIRDALLDDDDPPVSVIRPPSDLARRSAGPSSVVTEQSHESASQEQQQESKEPKVAPFDSEAT